MNSTKCAAPMYWVATARYFNLGSSALFGIPILASTPHAPLRPCPVAYLCYLQDYHGPRRQQPLLRGSRSYYDDS